MKPKIAFVFGTRPEIIKLSSVINECRKRRIPFVTIYSGQHFSDNMSGSFFKEFGLPRSDYNLDVRSKAPHMQGDHTGSMMVKLEKILLEELPSVVVVQGDTNTTLAGALTASKISTTKSFSGLDMKVAHVEAGLRSHDRSMPEEINRVMTDHLSDYLFAPTEKARRTALSEGISRKKVFVTGNTIVDVLKDASKAAKGRKVLTGFGLAGEWYLLLTLHRQENVDNAERFRKILEGIETVHAACPLPVVFPAHPRTVKKLRSFGIKLPSFIKKIEPCSFAEFLRLEENARLVLTDSGGVQEECCVLRVPCVTLRTTTERPETVDVGANIIAGVEPLGIAEAARKMLQRKRSWRNPFGDGRAAERIVRVLTNRV